jgi:hypothetical protein
MIAPASLALIIPGRLNRIMNAVVSASLVRGMMAKMVKKTPANRLVKREMGAKTSTQPQRAQPCPRGRKSEVSDRTTSRGKLLTQILSMTGI